MNMTNHNRILKLKRKEKESKCSYRGYDLVRGEFANTLRVRDHNLNVLGLVIIALNPLASHLVRQTPSCVLLSLLFLFHPKQRSEKVLRTYAMKISLFGSRREQVPFFYFLRISTRCARIARKHCVVASLAFRLERRKRRWT